MDNKLTVKEVLRVALIRLENQQSNFVCPTLKDIKYHGFCSDEEYTETKEYFDSQKPTETLHKEFFDNQYFTGGFSWWNNQDEDGHDLFDGATEEGSYLERQKFLRYLIDQIQ